MVLDVKTLAWMQCLIFITQVLILFIQLKAGKTYRGVEWWVFGTLALSLGVMLMPLVSVPSLKVLAGFANPLMVFGQILLYIGIMRFLGKKENPFILGTIFVVFCIPYSYYAYVDYNLSARTIVLSATLAVIALMTAYRLTFRRDRKLLVSEAFSAAVFAFYGCFGVFRFFYALIAPPVLAYSDAVSVLIAGFILPTIISVLWTFGFILMLNQRLNVEVQESEEKYRSILNASPDVITITDLNGQIIMVSPASKKMFGYEDEFEDLVGWSVIDCIVPEDVERAKADMAQIYQGGFPKANEYLGLRKDRSTFHIEVNSALIKGLRGQAIKVVFIIRDITERKVAEEKIQLLVEQLERERNIAHQNSITDSLTGLANRRYFDDKLATELYRLKRNGSVLSLIMLDVDYFKNFNDTKGHLAGDDCLRQIGHVLKSVAGRTTDIAARYGGEEFFVILPDTEAKDAVSLAEQMRKAVADLMIPHPQSHVSEYVTVSIGVATVSADCVTSPEQVITLVDEALYLAKKGGRNQVREKTKMGA